MDKQSYLFKGKLTAVSPLQVSYKDAVFGRNDPIRRLPRNGPMRDGVPAYFPSTSLRGALRHALHRVIVQACADKETGQAPFTLDQHFMMAQGVDITNRVVNESGDGDIDFFTELREKNPALSLGGRWKMAGKVGVSPALPVHPSDPIGLFGGGTRTIAFERDESLLETLPESETERLQRVLREQALAAIDGNEVKAEIKELTKLLKKADDDDKEDIKAQIAAQEKRLDAVKDNKEVRESIRRPLESYEAFVAGTEFQHRMRLINGTELELGLWLAALREFARQPVLGGKRALGFGEVEACYAVSSWLPDENAPSILGEVSFSDEGFTVTGEHLKAALAHWDAVRGELSQAGIDFGRYLAKADA